MSRDHHVPSAMNSPLPRAPLRLAVVGAGPVGLALALDAAQRLPQADISLFDARSPERDVSADPRTLALSLGSVQWLQRLGAWPAEGVQPILEVNVSQQPPSAPPMFAALFGEPEVRIAAHDEAVPMLGAVLSYGRIVTTLQQAWFAAAAAQPQRLHTRFGTPVGAVKPVAGGVEIDAGIAEAFDLAVIAEGGVFADQARKAIRRDYGQAAWSVRSSSRPGRRAAWPTSASRATARWRCCRCPTGGPRWCGACGPTRRAPTTRWPRSPMRSASPC